jgi:hypothetical protein
MFGAAVSKPRLEGECVPTVELAQQDWNQVRPPAEACCTAFENKEELDEML